MNLYYPSNKTIQISQANLMTPLYNVNKILPSRSVINNTVIFATNQLEDVPIILESLKRLIGTSITMDSSMSA